MHATVVYYCGCLSALSIPPTMDRASIQLVKPLTALDQVGETFNVEVVRMATHPPTYVETRRERPEWAKHCHAMVAFDIRVFEHANVKRFDELFASWRERFGPYVPQCHLPDILAGRGRYYGLWAWQAPVHGRQVEHLCVVAEAPEAEGGTLIAE